MCSDRITSRMERELPRIKRLFPDANVIFDVGSNVGVHTCLFSEFYPNSKIYTFEPVPQTYMALVQNVNLNNLKNVTCFNFGFLEKELKQDLCCPLNRDSENSGLYSTKIPDGKNKVSSHFYNFGDWCVRNNIIPDLLKIDVEGAEFEILNSSDCIIHKIKYLIIEDNPTFASLHRKTLKSLIKLNFDIVGRNQLDLLCKNKVKENNELKR